MVVTSQIIISGFDINITVTAGNSAKVDRPISFNIKIFFLV